MTTFLSNGCIATHRILSDSSTTRASLMKLFVCILALVFFPTSSLQATLTDKDKEVIGIEAYIYGYPLVTMEMTRRVMTNTITAGCTKAPMGQFAHARSYPDPDFNSVTTPNADTLYSSAWLDLTKEPYVLEVPQEEGRYYLLPLLSAWTNVFSAIGTRTTGTDAQRYVIVGPEWKGIVPSTLVATVIEAPTNLVWILGRTYSTGTPEDYAAVHALQDRYKLIPLSAYGKPYTPKPGSFNPMLDMQTSVRDQVNRMNAETFFKELAHALKTNKPAPEDAPLIAKMKRIGLLTDPSSSAKKTATLFHKTLAQVPQKALQIIKAHSKKAGTLVNGWLLTLKTGSYGTDYLQRAYIALIGLGANLPQDAVYPMATMDSTGRALNGSFAYNIHFSKDNLPPVKGFWSLTLYNDSYFFAKNPLNRYTLSPRNDLRYNPDGSLDLYIQHDSPDKSKRSNWLPAPPENFILALRLYWPEESVIKGTWHPPAVKRVVTAQNTMKKTRRPHWSKRLPRKTTL